ncbi:hypothetical protein F5146DRAFT_1000324 [Armillaria mellea]|nr:hypothetical protein F5146DRAFT_1000324 [Armillaria mellea]
MSRLEEAARESSDSPNQTHRKIFAQQRAPSVTVYEDLRVARAFRIRALNQAPTGLSDEHGTLMCINSNGKPEDLVASVELHKWDGGKGLVHKLINNPEDQASDFKSKFKSVSTSESDFLLACYPDYLCFSPTPDTPHLTKIYLPGVSSENQSPLIIAFAFRAVGNLTQTWTYYSRSIDLKAILPVPRAPTTRVSQSFGAIYRYRREKSLARNVGTRWCYSSTYMLRFSGPSIVFVTCSKNIKSKKERVFQVYGETLKCARGKKQNSGSGPMTTSGIRRIGRFWLAAFNTAKRGLDVGICFWTK